MISLEEYQKNPCAVSSLPFWKSKGIKIPDQIKIVHHQEFSSQVFADYTDTPYFRLYHALPVKKPLVPHGLILRTVEPHELEDVVSIINRSYDDLSVTLE